MRRFALDDRARPVGTAKKGKESVASHTLSWRVFTLAAALALIPTVAGAQRVSLGPDPKHPDPQRYAKAIDAYGAADQEHMPGRCQILFLGSASIAIWKTLADDMAPTPVIGRGFGGSTIADQIYYFDRIATPYHPRAIFFYAGENDVSDGLEPAEVMSDLNRFLALKTKVLGAATPVYYLAIKPSPYRLADTPNQERVNELAKALAAKRKDFHYIDTAHDSWEDANDNGLVSRKLKPIYLADGIHMNRAGYENWISILKPLVQQEAQRPTTCK